MRQSSQPAQTYVGVGEALTRHIAALAAAGPDQGIALIFPIDDGPAVVRCGCGTSCDAGSSRYGRINARSSVKLNWKTISGRSPLVVPVKGEGNLTMVSDAEVVA